MSIDFKKATRAGWPFRHMGYEEELEEEARRHLHLAIRLRARDLAEARRRSEGCRGSNLSYREGTAGRLEVCMVDDVKGIDPELEVQGFPYLEVLRDRGVEVCFAGCAVRVA